VSLEKTYEIITQPIVIQLILKLFYAFESSG